MLPIIFFIPYALAGTTNRCHICGDKGNNGMKYPLGYLESAKRTCASLALSVFSDPKANCVEERKRASKCCDGTKLPFPPITIPPQIPDIIKTGSNPICHICRDGSLPTDMHHVINMLYIGAGTCEQYWKAGRQGVIPAHLCDPLMFFAKDPCGCKPPSIPNPIKSITRGRFEFKSNRHDAQSMFRSLIEMFKFMAIGVLIGLFLAVIIHTIM